MTATTTPPPAGAPDLRKVLIDVRQALQQINDANIAIVDTLWMPHNGGPETVFDYIDAALADSPYDPSGALPQSVSVPEQFDFQAHLARQAAWSEKTFGPGARTAGVCDHIRKELLEIQADPLDLKEWIDVVILALDGAWRCGGSPSQIIDGIVAKQTKNEGRNWPDWRTADSNKAIEHDRSGETTAAPLPQPQADARQEITINGRQLRDALEAAWPDRSNPEEGDTELTLFVRKQDDVSVDGEAMPRGLWFYWSDYPEEGVCQLDADAPKPAGPEFKHFLDRAMPSDGGASALDGLPHQGEGSIDSDLPPLPQSAWTYIDAACDNRRIECYNAEQMSAYAKDAQHIVWCAEVNSDGLREENAELKARLARTAAPIHETIVREGNVLTCTTCGTSAAMTDPTAAPSEPLTDEQLSERLRQVMGARAVANIESGRNISLTMDQARELCMSSPAPLEGQAIPTDLSKRLRKLAIHDSQPLGRIFGEAADEIDRYYGGMLAWKRTAEAKNAKLSEETTARVDARVAELLTELRADQGVRICHDADRECGDRQGLWCHTCPKRAASAKKGQP